MYFFIISKNLKSHFVIFKVYFIFILFDGYFELTDKLFLIKDVVNKELDSIEKPVLNVIHLMTNDFYFFFF
jgi:hypothetical protein